MDNASMRHCGCSLQLAARQYHFAYLDLPMTGNPTYLVRVVTNECNNGAAAFAAMAVNDTGTGRASFTPM
jgi:hypothetical protein